MREQKEKGPTQTTATGRLRERKKKENNSLEKRNSPSPKFTWEAAAPRVSLSQAWSRWLE